MSTWMNDAVQNHNGNGFPMNDTNPANAMMDPSVFMANNGHFNPAQFQNQQPQQAQHHQHPQQMQALQNGPLRNASPSSFQNPVYQTNPVIPSKRPRPREDSLAGSPTQNPGMLPTSRAQTPQQQNFSNYPQGQMSQPNAPGQFPHLQANGSANASPSPIMANQMRPGSVPQRVSTASPHPFSPSAQQFGNQGSPIPSEHGTPQPNQFMPNTSQGFNPNFAQSPSNPRPSPNPNAMAGSQMMGQQMGQMPQQMGQMGNNMYQMQQQAQHHHQQQQQQQQAAQQQRAGPPQQQQMTDQQKMAAYQIRLQQQLQGNMQMQAQMQNQGMGRGMMAKQPQAPGMPNGQSPQGPGAMQQRRPMPNINPEHFMKNLAALMNAKGLPLDPNPLIGDRPVNLVMLFQAVQNRGSYKAITAANGWAYIAQGLGLPAQVPTVAPTLKAIYERNLLKFEEAWIAQQKQRLIAQQQSQQQSQQPSQQQPQHPQQQQHPQQHPQQHAQPPQPPPQATPRKPFEPAPQTNHAQMHQAQQAQLQQQQQQQQQQQHQQQHQQPLQQQQIQLQTPVKPAPPSVNGFSTPQQHHQEQGRHAPPQARNSMSRGGDAVRPPEFPQQSPSHLKPGHVQPLPVTQPTEPPVDPTIYQPRARRLSNHHGGIETAGHLPQLAADVAKWDPCLPNILELGHIDIMALTRSLQSGIHGEVRLALDTIALAASSPHQQHAINLRYCDDLLDALIDCAEEQVDLLAENTVEVSDEIQLTPYEDIVRACRVDQWTLKESQPFGSDEYELDMAVERLLCITMTLRNLSFPGEQNDNHMPLAEESVIKFFCSVIRYMGTRTMLLRTHTNTLEFMKDIVTMLSNIAGAIEIPGREQALCLLQFLLAFAPSPGPVKVDDSLMFTPYDPSVNYYLPNAVDVLAKLLARDEPNRTHYKTLFASDASSSASYELLHRTFALAISPIPDTVLEQKRPPNLPSMVETRKPFLMQGLLAAEIIASMAPGPESGVAAAWLAPANGLGQTLFDLIRRLSRQFEQPNPPNRNPRTVRKDPELVYIAVTAVSLLRKLVEKAKDPGATDLVVPFFPSSQVLFEATAMQSPEWTKEGFLQHLTACFNLAL